MQIVDPTVKRWALLILPGLLDKRGLSQLPDLLLDIQLNHAPPALITIRDTFKFPLVDTVDILDVSQPLVDQPKILV